MKTLDVMQRIEDALTLKHQIPFEPGSCFEQALELLVFNDNVTSLIHGIATGSTKSEFPGKRFAHAWIEIQVLGEWFVIDASAQSGPFPREFYYEAGRIKPEECVRYDRQSAMRKAYHQNTAGPWHKYPEGVL